MSKGTGKPKDMGFKAFIKGKMPMKDAPKSKSKDKKTAPKKGK